MKNRYELPDPILKPRTYFLSDSNDMDVEPKIGGKVPPKMDGGK